MAAARKISAKPIHVRGKGGAMHRLFFCDRKSVMCELCVGLPTIYLTIDAISPLSDSLIHGSDLCDRNARIVSGSEDSSTKGCLR